jgi:hypothetical protein
MTISFLRINLIIIFFTFSLSAQGQFKYRTDIIPIPNGSFEGTHREGAPPKFWASCGSNSTPDILPGPWGVTLLPKDGNSYLGLTAREDKTFESISCKLPIPLQKDSCYSFNVSLSRSQAYAGFNGIGTFRMWGGNHPCEKKQLLALSVPIGNFEWKNFVFNFVPNESYNFISIECFYKTPSLFPYRANILIDALLFFEACERA